MPFIFNESDARVQAVLAGATELELVPRVLAILPGTCELIVDRPLAAHHGVGLAGTGLPIHEDRPVDAFECSQHHFPNGLLVDITIRVPFSVN